MWSFISFPQSLKYMWYIFQSRIENWGYLTWWVISAYFAKIAWTMLNRQSLLLGKYYRTVYLPPRVGLEEVRAAGLSLAVGAGASPLPRHRRGTVSHITTAVTCRPHGHCSWTTLFIYDKIISTAPLVSDHGRPTPRLPLSLPIYGHWPFVQWPIGTRGASANSVCLYSLAIYDSSTADSLTLLVILLFLILYI